jgi:hypothetical protein
VGAAPAEPSGIDMSQLSALLGAATPAAEPSGFDLSSILGGMGGGAPVAEAEESEVNTEDAEKAMISKLLGGL